MAKNPNFRTILFNTVSACYKPDDDHEGKTKMRRMNRRGEMATQSQVQDVNAGSQFQSVPMAYWTSSETLKQPMRNCPSLPVLSGA